MLHTYDLILTELFIALLWFNPFVYFFRNSIKAVHEFQVDDKVLKNGTSVKNYLELLLTEIKSNNMYSASYFRSSIIKKRIKMMTNKKTKQVKMLRYLLSIPLIMIVLSAFSPNMNATISVTSIPENPPSIPPIKRKNIKRISFAFGEVGMNPFLKKEVKHGGIDIPAKKGTPVFATASGEVKKIVDRKDWGKLVVISHCEKYETWYAHLDN